MGKTNHISQRQREIYFARICGIPGVLENSIDFMTIP
jgi:hypothetical protein